MGVPSGTRLNARPAISRSVAAMLPAKPLSSSNPRRTRAFASSPCRSTMSVMGRCTFAPGNGYAWTPPTRCAASPAPFDGLVEYGAGALNDLEELVEGRPENPLEAWDPEHIRRTLPWLGAINAAYFRPDVRGLENIPGGPSLLVGNHSGGLVIADTFVFSAAFYDHFGPDRRFHQLAHDVAAKSPLLGLIRRYGVVPASHDNARAAFKLGAPVLVYPGGDYETFRPSWHSDQIEFGGRQGFVRLALEEKVPIVPVVAIGGQETALFVTRGQRAARLTGLAELTRIKVLPVALAPP